MEKYYWNLTLKDGQVIPIPPKGVPIVQKKMELREVIKTPRHRIPFSEIKSFEQSAKVYEGIPLEEEAAKAFNEPMLTSNDEGVESIKARWVKKRVTQGEYNNHYSKGQGYTYLSNEDGFVWVAFTVAAHQVDTTKVEYCNSDDVKKLTRH